MPSYDYQCKECNHVFTKFSKISERNIPTENPCPECGAEESVSQSIGAVPFNYNEMGGSLRRAGDGWKEVLSKVKEGCKINNIRD